MMIIALAIIRRPILYVIKIKTNNKINKNNNTKLIQKEAAIYELILQCPLMIYNIPGEVV